ncbi:MAG: Gfo/Idh/MocA family oxidoreductase [Chitinophagaceae bacterium]|nr:Gfo/Idh/MocA family oxidoreductase [Chitinophagaceae bacterium]
MPLRFAIAGCGKIAPRHAAEMARQGQVAAVCDIIPERAEEMATSYNARPYLSMDELLSKETIDVMAVCTPNGLHAEHSIKALQAGAHVLCEKPLCISSKDAHNMMQVAANAQRKLFVVKSTRYNPALAAMKKGIEDGSLGDIYSFQMNCFWNRPAAYYANSWKGDLEMDGGTLYTQFSHYIDAMLWLFGEVRSVSGFRKNYAHQGIIDFEDSGVASLEMENGMIGGISWSVNSFRKNMEVELTIIAQKGSVQIGGEYMNKVIYNEASSFCFPGASEGQPNDYGYYKGSMSNHDKVYENLMKAINDDSHPFANASDGLRTVETIERIYKNLSLT